MEVGYFLTGALFTSVLACPFIITESLPNSLVNTYSYVTLCGAILILISVCSFQFYVNSQKEQNL